MGLLEDLTEVTNRHHLDVRKTWPGSHVCSCGWEGYPVKPSHWGKPHHVHLAEVLAEWFEQYEQ